MRREPGALRERAFDLAVIGGGMHGAWLAARAASAGLSVALLERGDFAAGTSANSLKILHGGLRYLQSLDFPRMRNSIRARRAFARTSPHLFAPLPCVIPLGVAGMRSPWIMGPALLANDLISADRNSGVDADAQLPAGGLLTGSVCRTQLAGLVDRKCLAGARWWDGIARDTHRLVMDAVHRAHQRGAVVVNHVEVERILVTAQGRVHGLEVRELIGGGCFEVQARHVINATGPWAAELVRRSGLRWGGREPAFIGGLNLVLRRPLEISSAVALTSAATGGKGRELFFVPWQGVTLVGTDYCRVPQHGEPPSRAPAAAIQGFLAQAAQLAPRAGLTPEDIGLVLWGVMPADAPDAPQPARRPVMRIGREEAGAEGLAHVIAEKLTSAPVLSRRVLAALRPGGGLDEQATHELAASPTGADALAALSPVVRSRLRARYGVYAAQVAATAGDRGLLSPLAPDCEAMRLEVRYAVEAEMACTLADVLRRVGLGDCGHPGDEVLEACAAEAGRLLSWSEDERRRQVTRCVTWFRDNLAGQD